MRTYGQYCPIARGAEIFAERWTPIIARNIVLLGCRTFTQIEAGAPGIPRTLLTQRLKTLERAGIIERSPNPRGRGFLYAPTAAGEELRDVIESLGVWGARWLEVAPEHLDPYVALWSMCNCLDRDRLPPERTVVRFDVPDAARGKRRFWVLIEDRRGEVCVKHPGFEESLVVTADSWSLVGWQMGRVEWSDAVRAGRISVEGPRALGRAFPTWNLRSHFAPVEPRVGVAEPRRRRPA